MPSTAVFACHSKACAPPPAEEFTYNPSQRRVPAGQKGGGRWTRDGGGVSRDSGYTLWTINGFSYSATAAAARITSAEGNWDATDDGDSWAEDVARSMLNNIHKEKIRTTKYYSGHGAGWGHLTPGDTIDIPLMAITPAKSLAMAYSGADTPGKRSAEVRRNEALSQAAKVIEGVEGGLTPEGEEAIRAAFMQINAKNQGLRSSKYFQPVTVFEFENNKSTPVRPNERVTSGKYVVTRVERAPDRTVLWDSDKLDFVDAYHQVVSVKFVKDLPIKDDKPDPPKKIRASALVAACYDASCRPPTSGGTGGSTPGRATGHKIGGEMVYEFNDDGQRGFSVKGKDGASLRAVFSVKNPPFGDDPRTDIDNGIHDGIAMEALTGLKLAYDLAPTRVTPGIVIGDWSKHPKLRQRGDTYGFVIQNAGPQSPIGRGKIGINITKSTYEDYLGESKPSNLMPVADKVSFATYVAAHEYGHHRQFEGSDGQQRHQPLKSLYAEFKDDPNLSQYGKENYLEAGAEAFASWALEGGIPATRVERRYAEEFRWGLRREDFSAITLLERPDQIEIIADSFSGPFYVLKNGTTLTT